MENVIVFGKTPQSPDRVIAAVQAPDLTLLAAITIHDGRRIKSDVIDKARTDWQDCFGVELPEDLSEQIATAPTHATGVNNQVSLHMCSRGPRGCHVVMLNGQTRRLADDHVHSSDPQLVQTTIERWARGTTSNPAESFWLQASGLSRLGELCSDETLNWARKGFNLIVI